jgi:rare lipoprotein A
MHQSTLYSDSWNSATTRSRSYAFLLVVSVFSGCSSVPRPVSESLPSGKAPASSSRPSLDPSWSGSASAGLKRPGGYYLDDGPEENPPENLHSVPDAEPKPEPLHKFANRPYVALGQQYSPDVERRPYKAQGVATWYGKRFHGSKTSAGEIYDMYAMTAAHRTLPLPSYARVTHLGNGRSVVVRVNDRGPFYPDRLIDLSYTAAYKLDMLAAGSAVVEIEVLLPEDAPPMQVADIVSGSDVTDAAAKELSAAPTSLPAVPVPASPAQTNAEQIPVAPVYPEQVPSPMYVQLGAFRARENAETFLQRVQREFSSAAENLTVYVKDGLFRVHAGPYRDQSEARSAAARIGKHLRMRPVVMSR